MFFSLTILRPYEVFDAVSKRFTARYEVHEPEWTNSPFGRLARGLFWDAHVQWRSERRLAMLWSNAHYILGGASVTLAAVSGVGGLTELLGASAAALVALAAAVTAALATFLETDKMRQRHRQLAAAWDLLRDDIIVVWETRPLSQGDADAEADPEGWELLIASFRSRAHELRTNLERGPGQATRKSEDPAVRPIPWEKKAG